MKNSRTASFLFFTLLFASSLIMSCKSTSNGPASPTPSIMDAGSTYTMLEFNNFAYDTLVFTVFATTMTNPQTHANAIGLSEERLSNRGIDTMYMSFESNGDVSLSSSLSTNPAQWQTLPFSSHTPKTSDYSIGGTNPSLDTATAVWNGAGAAFSVNGQSYNSTDSVTLTVINLFTTPPPATATGMEHYTYLPEIGIIAIDDVDGGAQNTLISYSLK